MSRDQVRGLHPFWRMKTSAKWLCQWKPELRTHTEYKKLLCSHKAKQSAIIKSPFLHEKLSWEFGAFFEQLPISSICSQHPARLCMWRQLLQIISNTRCGYRCSRQTVQPWNVFSLVQMSPASQSRNKALMNSVSYSDQSLYVCSGSSGGLLQSAVVTEWVCHMGSSSLNSN